MSTALEEKAVLGKVGARFDTQSKVDLLMQFRRQQAIANHLLFCHLLPQEVLDQVAELVGYVPVVETWPSGIKFTVIEPSP